ncbi:hypothetical protein NLD30_07605 [SCandidatus Aminicenantes bacterium Aminicenantia_JdfR_composite]|jgi:Tfp pilus assembly PilM family ATPase|nr:hypothetical protein [SCandidatus Aminicenantes bacterium Aminicenantia_JdfR_composite]MCP2605672.1 hypothetical protein [Candidatus Aminicenantes bacterium AC-335-O07]MCP2620565.1 hypothetical protein [Candidatus Aminicenantes bacterium AC-334-E05]
MNVFKKINDFFLKIPYPKVSFSFLPYYVAGIKIENREIDSYFVYPLSENVLKPSFYDLNIVNPEYLKEIFEKELSKIKSLPKTVSLLLPEHSTRIFLLNFNLLPPKKEEIEKLIIWKIKKTIHLPEDGIRLAWERIDLKDRIKIIAFIASEKVVAQYENFLAEFNLNAGLIESPIFSLFNIIQDKVEGNNLLIDLEKSFLTILGFNNTDFLIYRVKSISLLDRNDFLKEIDHTLKFLKDKSGIEVNSLILRVVNSGDEESLHEILRENFSIPVSIIDPFSTISFSKDLSFQEKQILSPLVGQTLWRDLNL